MRVLLSDLSPATEDALVEAFAASGQPVVLARQATAGAWDVVIVSHGVDIARSFAAPHAEVWVAGTEPSWSGAPDDVIDTACLRPATLACRLQRVRRAAALAVALDMADAERRELARATRMGLDREVARAEAAADRHGTSFGVLLLAAPGASPEAVDRMAVGFRASDRWIRVSPTRWAGVLEPVDEAGLETATQRIRASCGADAGCVAVGATWRKGMRPRELLRRVEERLLVALSDGERAAG